MAALDTSRTAYVASSAVSRFFATALGAVTEWNDARITRRALSTLSDRELDDIGLVRGDIDSMAQSNLIR